MDNFSHSLVGAFAAVPFITRDAKSPNPRPQLLFWLSILANNLPDGDLLYCNITEPPFGYVVHHRGHTHTLAFLLLAPLLIMGVLSVLLRALKHPLSKSQRRSVWALSYLGIGLHLAMDYLNSYGVHPFWPFSSDWYYGDTLFILEPSLWIIILPFLFFFFKSFLGRSAVLVGIATSFFLMGASGAVAWQVIMVLGAFGAALFWYHAHASLRPSWYVTLGAIVLCIGLFAVNGAQVRRTITDQITARHNTVLHDIALQPLPGNPFCWKAITIETTSVNLIARRAIVGAWGIPAQKCFNRFFPAIERLNQQFLRPEPQVAASAVIGWQDYFTAPIAEFKALDRNNCAAATFFRFARTPYFDSNNGNAYFGDLRFTRGALVQLQSKVPPIVCPTLVPHWSKPREDILEGNSN